MSREIKFRAYRKKGQKMIYGVTNLQIAIDKGYELMQFTGLEDKNGTEIYEGDIMAGDEVMGSCRVYFGKNEFDARPYAWCIEWTDSKNTGFLDASICSLKVVGNIFQNPELLQTAQY
jgi:uncharacterized phage protein (TIGR01671 family)